MSYLTHRRQLTVEWGHCDPAGIVFNSRFFEFFDHSTWLLFERALALPPAGIGAIYGVSMPLVDAKASFLLPAKLGDLVEIETTIGEFRRSSFDVRHNFAASVGYNIPAPARPEFAHSILGNWGLDAIIHAQTGTPLNLFAKLILVSSRSVNSLVWALLFVGIFGPGALAGTLAIAFRSIGFVGKLFGEAIEETARGPIEALDAAGAPWLARMTFGYWPQVKPAFWSIALFRWDINVRESAVLGLVGAGGIGMILDSALNLFQWNRVATILLAIFVVVILAEIVVTFVRRRIL